MTVSSIPPSGSSHSDTAKIGLMQGKKGLVMGVANDRSIGWGIAAAAAGQGAELAFTYQGDALKKRVNPLAESVRSDLVLPCDVTDEESVDLV
ncbi:MAG: SDR family oxidoreductase, partial [Pseudomonadota bacterium]|nr:SDR family oxidoreductase [Pseudomonadota bacterium]